MTCLHYAKYRACAFRKRWAHVEILFGEKTEVVYTLGCLISLLNFTYLKRNLHSPSSRAPSMSPGVSGAQEENLAARFDSSGSRAPNTPHTRNVVVGLTFQLCPHRLCPACPHHLSWAVSMASTGHLVPTLVSSMLFSAEELEGGGLLVAQSVEPPSVGFGSGGG